MKRIITILLSFLFISFQSANAEIGVGITAAAHELDASGTHTLRQSNVESTASHSETAAVPEFFVEAILDGGGAIGISYIPTRDLGEKSRSDTNADGDTGTYKASAELDNVIQVYADIPVVAGPAGSLFYGKVGVQHATVQVADTLNSGSKFPDKDLLGVTLGLGFKGDIPFGNNLYYKVEATFTDFEDYVGLSDSSVPNKVKADLESQAAKVSIGYKF